MEQGNTLAGDPVTTQQDGNFAELLISQHIILAKHSDGLLAVDLQPFLDAVDVPAQQLVQRKEILILTDLPLHIIEGPGQYSSSCTAQCHLLQVLAEVDCSQGEQGDEQQAGMHFASSDSRGLLLKRS
ncbi:hypothetical protein D3C80_1738300 [compost metagenome]